MSNEPTYRFFISSVINGLESERLKVKEIVNRNHNAQLSENFITNDSPKKAIQRRLEDSDGYIGIFDIKWGEVPPKNNPQKLSVSALEYYEAKRLGLPRFVFVSKNEEKEEELDKFLKEIGDYDDGIFWSRYENKDELIEVVTASLPQLIKQISNKKIPPQSNRSITQKSNTSISLSQWVGKLCGNCKYTVKDNDIIKNDKCPRCNYDLNGDFLFYQI